MDDARRACCWLWRAAGRSVDGRWVRSSDAAEGMRRRRRHPGCYTTHDGTHEKWGEKESHRRLGCTNSGGRGGGREGVEGHDIQSKGGEGVAATPDRWVHLLFALSRGVLLLAMSMGVLSLCLLHAVGSSNLIPRRIFPRWECK